MTIKADTLQAELVAVGGGGAGTPINVRLAEIAWEPYNLWVNKDGRRFMDEGYQLAFFAHGNALALQPEGISYSLFDSQTLKMIAERGLLRTGIFGAYTLHGFSKPGIPLPGLEREIKKQQSRDCLKIAESWDDIACWIRCQPQALKAMLEEYNAGCDRGHDSLFAKDQAYLRPLRTPPYYAIRCQGFICEALPERD